MGIKIRKVLVSRPGGINCLRIAEYDKPNPGANEVRIDVHAIGVNFADCLARMGIYAPSWKFEGWPLTPGFEVAGYVESVGPEVDDLEEGTPVIAITRFGGYTDCLIVPREQVFRWPSSRRLIEGAAFPVIFLTAKYAIDHLACLQSGASALIHSAAGGVGSALVQLARLRGCQVIGVVGTTEKIDAAIALGADHVIDRSKNNWVLAARSLVPKGFQAVFDANGRTFRKSFGLLSARGRLIAYGAHQIVPKGGQFLSLPIVLARYLSLPRFNPLQLTAENKSIMGFNLSYLFDENALLHDYMTTILQLLEGGQIVLPRISQYPLDEVQVVHHQLQSGTSIGKFVLTTR